MDKQTVVGAALKPEPKRPAREDEGLCEKCGEPLRLEIAHASECGPSEIIEFCVNERCEACDEVPF